MMQLEFKYLMFVLAENLLFISEIEPVRQRGSLNLSRRVLANACILPDGPNFHDAIALIESVIGRRSVFSAVFTAPVDRP